MRLPRQALTMAGYIVFACAAFLISLYITFPAGALAQRLTHEIQKQTAGVWRISFGHAAMYRFSGLALQDVTVEHQAPGDEAQKITVDSLRARIRLLPLLLLRQTYTASAMLRDGEIALVAAPRQQALDVQLTMDKVDLASPPLLGEMVGLPVGGKVSGSVEATWDADMRKSVGTANVEIATTSVGPGTVAGFALPTVSLGQLNMSAELKEGRIKLIAFKQQGGNAVLTAKGTVNMRMPLATSMLDACLTVRAETAFLNANPKIRTALQLAEVQVKKDGEGNLHLPLSGPLSSPRLGSTLCH